MKIIGKMMTTGCVAFALSLAIQASYGFVKILTQEETQTPARTATQAQLQRANDACAIVASGVTTGVTTPSEDFDQSVADCSKKATRSICEDTVKFIKVQRNTVPDALVCNGPEFKSTNACMTIFDWVGYHLNTGGDALWKDDDVALCNSGSYVCDGLLKFVREKNQRVDGLTCKGAAAPQTR